MSRPAVLQGEPLVALTLRPLGVADLDAVLAIEQRAYDFPWSRGHFTDSLASGYRLQMLEAQPCADGARRADRPAPRCLGYCVAMAGVEEMHLLNLTVDPDHQRRGHARRLLADLAQTCRDQGAQQLWLEVREGNASARRLYERWGFETVGRRKAYYPAAAGREDAVVMRLPLPGGPDHGLD